jgi:hypothetical protein
MSYNIDNFDNDISEQYNDISEQLSINNEVLNDLIRLSKVSNH